MKALSVLLMIALPVCFFGQGVFTNQTHSALQEVIGDYPNHFRNIQGQMLRQDPQTTDYSSTVQIGGAVNAVITKYSSNPDKEIYSWKCLLVESEDFAAVSSKYKELFDLMNNSIIKIDRDKPFILNGTYEVPTQTKRFATSTFYLLPASGVMSKVKVELSLQYYVKEWRLALLVYDREEGMVVH